MDKAENTSTENQRGWTRRTNWKSAEDFQKQFVVTGLIKVLNRPPQPDSPYLSRFQHVWKWWAR